MLAKMIVASIEIEVAAEWGDQLAALRKADPKGYVHHVQIHAGRGHWMNREDAVAVEWMARHTRNALPWQIVWRQDDVLHSDFYWLSLPDGQAKAREEIRAKAEGNALNSPGRLVAGDGEPQGWTR